MIGPSSAGSLRQIVKKELLFKKSRIAGTLKNLESSLFCSVLQQRNSLFTFPTQRARTAVFLAFDFLPAQDGISRFLVGAFDHDSRARVRLRTGQTHCKATPAK